ncbi:hypothetical protein [Undibacterium sp.]|uniref:hypothetical protein n=1 Tax=Undibacterium sp. TaxID=1914977 RepID=UPI0025FFEF7B|nr:hypothetical protein [Undibacterium sp.]
MQNRRRSPAYFTAIFLALLLLFTQQMGFAHAISHLSDLSSNSVKVKQVPLEQACDHCLAFAQVGSALTSDAGPFKATPPDAEVALSRATPDHCARTVCVFQSRAPPAVI